MALTANFLAQLTELNFKANIVIEIDGTYFSKYAVDSGLSIDADKIGVLDNVKLNGVALELRRANTPISTASVGILDKDGVFSSFMGFSASTLQGSELRIHMGFITGSFDWADYAEMSVTTINRIQTSLVGYSISSNEVTSLMQKELLNIFNPLAAAITDAQTTLDLEDASTFPSAGIVKIDEEFIAYTGKSTNTLTGLGRGDLTSTAAEHIIGARVSFVTEKDDNPMDMITDILINDMGISSSLIDLVSFSDLRDDEFSGEPNQVLYIYDVGDDTDGLKWIEENLLESTNTRLFSVNGKITIGLLDQAPLTAAGALPQIDEDHITGRPSWSITGDKIVNVVTVEWFFNEGTQTYARTTTQTDSDSVSAYGLRKSLNLTFKGIQDLAVVQNRISRLLARLSTPRASIKLNTHFNRFDINLAENVEVTHRYLPQQGAGLGFNGVLEVMSKSVSNLEKSPSIAFGLEFTSYTGIRFGLISPSPKLDLAIASQKEFTVPDGSCYEVGYVLRLFDNINNLYFADAVNTVESINGNVITMVNNFTTTLGANVSLYFADYDDSSINQRTRYSYVAPDAGIFLIDGSKAYQIIF